MCHFTAHSNERLEKVEGNTALWTTGPTTAPTFSAETLKKKWTLGL
jgi:hypothetical protein